MGRVRQERRRTPLFPVYAEFMMGGSRLPRKLSRAAPVAGPDMAKARFAPSAVETFHPVGLKRWIPEEQWSYVEVIISFDAFEERVLLSDWRSRANARRGTHTTRMSRFHIDDLREKSYIRRARSVRFVCQAFAVWKSDGEFLRLIWNGIDFNRICHPPPHFIITPLPIALARLLDPSVMAYLTYDFRTWFVQLSVVAEVSEFFAVRFPSGEIWILSGVPMGWSWACAIAHTLTQAFARAVFARLGLRREEVTFDFCIDNTIVAIRTLRISPATIYESVVELAAELGIVLKPSATEMGSKVEWLPYSLDMVTGTAALKPALRTKLAGVSPPTGKTSRLDVWRTCGLVVWATYAAMWPLTRVKSIMAWLARNAPPNDDQERWHDEVVFPLWQRVADVARRLTETTIQRPHSLLHTPSEESVWFLSDAASTGNNVYLVFSPTTITRRVWASVQGMRIEESELAAFLEATQYALGSEDGRGTILGYCDNTTALSSVWDGYSLWATPPTARHLEDLKARAKDRGPLGVHVGTARNLADVWTRVVPWPHAQSETKMRCTRHRRTAGYLCPCDEAVVRAWQVPSDKVKVVDAWFAAPPPSFQEQLMLGREWDWWGEVTEVRSCEEW